MNEHWKGAEHWEDLWRQGAGMYDTRFDIIRRYLNSWITHGGWINEATLYLEGMKSQTVKPILKETIIVNDGFILNEATLYSAEMKSQPSKIRSTKSTKGNRYNPLKRK